MDLLRHDINLCADLYAAVSKVARDYKLPMYSGSFSGFEKIYLRFTQDSCSYLSIV